MSTYAVFGPHGGLSTRIIFPDNFNPKEEKCPMVVLMHGFMSKKDFYPIPNVAKALAKEGIASISFDFDAHGNSQGKFKDMTIASEIADAKAIVEYANNLPFVSSVAFVGHSQGGVIAGMLAGELEDTPLKPACLVQLAPAAVLKDDAIKGQCMNARYNPLDPPEYVRIMFFFKLGREFIVEAQKLPIYETSCKYTGKVLLIHGAEDNIVPVSYSEKYHDLYQNSELHVLEGENHMLNKDKLRTVGMVVDFLKKTFSALK